MRLFSSSRKDLLETELRKLDIDATSLHNALERKLKDPSVGYDGKFGKSAMRTFQAFLYPKKADSDEFEANQQDTRLEAAAVRCAKQIEFLLKRHRAHEEDFVRHTDSAGRERQVFPLVLILDNLRSAFNVGSIFRTADAAGCELVITTGICPRPLGPGSEKLEKSSLGAERIVPSRHFDSLPEAIDFCRKELSDYQILGMETTEKSKDYRDYQFNRSGVVFVLGNEVTGIDPKYMSEMDDIIEIPMFGLKNSLNVAACAPIVLFETLRQWR